jgi:4-diphosphocytidyl-2-C-methyl-D-erythritol kinase
MIKKAHAKLNLTLNIVDKRPDGYHNIETIMFPLELHDSIEINVLNGKNLDDFVVCDNYNVGISKYNLCHKAINVARQKWGFKQHFDIFIHKNIFLQSGLGGGSADAAAVLKAIVKLLNIKCTNEELIDVARQVGSDVPFMLFNKPALVSGIGEKIEYFTYNHCFDNYYVLLVKPLAGLSTTEVYTEYENCEKKYFDVPAAEKACANGDLNKLHEVMGNSLENSAFKLLPVLNDIKKSLTDDGFEFVFMTGGGSTMVGLTTNKRLANKCLKKYYLDKKYETELTTFYRNADK